MTRIPDLTEPAIATAAAHEATSAAVTPKFVPVKQLAALYGLNVGVVYEWIKTDSTFPYVNTGVKKKFMVQLDLFETWLQERTQRQKNDRFGIPTTDELLQLFRKDKK